jgi:hypothetical protein
METEEADGEQEKWVLRTQGMALVRVINLQTLPAARETGSE